jgi:hypothetical protein
MCENENHSEATQKKTKKQKKNLQSGKQEQEARNFALKPP